MSTHRTEENRILLTLRFVAAASLFLVTGKWVSSSQQKLLLFAALGFFLAISAGAGDAKVSPLRLVSVTYPLPAPNTPGWCGSPGDYQDWEQETTIAVNPTNPKNLVAAWIQDYADAIVASYSMDGGGHWTVVVPPTTPCTGGLTQFGTAPGEVSVIDPSLSFGPDGTLYLSSLVEQGLSGPTASVLNRSLDGGRTWSPPVVVEATDLPFNDDWSYIIADPVRAGYAYKLWDKMSFGAGTRYQYVSHTTDDGVTWSQPAPITSPLLANGGQLLVLQDGTLVNVVGEVPPQPLFTGGIRMGPTTLTARRSTDLGETWSTPTVIAVADPKNLSGGTAALAPDGTAYVIWQTPDETSLTGSSFTLSYSRSTDGGGSWQQPGAVVANDPGPPDSSGPILAVAPDGTVGVAFYDHRNDNPGTNPPRVTDLWLRYSRDGGASWTETHLAGPFDQTTAPNANNGSAGRVAGGSIGDYQGIAAIAGGFVNAFALAKPVGATGTPNADGFYANPTDIYFARVNVH